MCGSQVPGFAWSSEVQVWSSCPHILSSTFDFSKMSTTSSAKRKNIDPADADEPTVKKTAKEKVYIVNQLHYRNNDCGHNSASVQGVFDSEAKAVACMHELYEDLLKNCGSYEREVDAYKSNKRCKLSEIADHEADTDEFNIECHDVL